MTESLLAAARAAQANAHAPYSRYKVGAALATPDGRVFAGCNVENAAYPSGTCAEAGAIAAMVAAGGRAITEILVVGDGPEPITPCGNCRQRIREFADAATRVHAAGAAGVLASFTLDELLPASFGPRHLPPV
ncbi:cytidine deaminase [Pseudorhodoferax sp. LjRoot39]|uniref:cytidine deaminase n=1 Tax=Pseudorhodoferax sp. LjRoot39 TaxID=3342328 RepID=UPI003ECD9C62